MSQIPNGIAKYIDDLRYGGTSLTARICLMFMAGLLGGALAWMAVGRTGWLSYTVSIPGLPAVAEGKLALHRIEVGMTIGGLLGLLIGVTDAFAFDRMVDRLRTICCLVIAGLVFGAIALQLGVPAAVPGMGLDSPSAGTSAGVAAAQIAIAHGEVWAVIGLGLGIVPGLLRRAPMLIRQGAFGGVLGGLASGFVAMMAPPLTSTVLPGLPTLPAFLTGGAMIGLFCSAAPYLFRSASLRIVRGRYAGKEYLLAAPVTLIGSGPASDILLAGDPEIAPSHCSIEESADHLILRPVTPNDSSFTPILVNGKGAIAPVLLRSGDELTIGTYRLLFLTRDAAHAPASEAATVTSVPAKIEPSPSAGPSQAPRRPKNLDAAIAAKAAVEVTEPIAIAKPSCEMAATVTSGARGAAEITEPFVVAAGVPKSGDTMTTDKTDRIRRRDLAALHKANDGPKLICLDGPNKGHVYLLPADRPITIGRGTDRDIALVDDHAASRDHAVVIAANGRHVVRDEGSANGTLLNNLPLKAHDPHHLESGDVILIGRTALVYEVT